MIPVTLGYMSIGEILPDALKDGHRPPNSFAGGTLDTAAEKRGDAEWVVSCRKNEEARVVPMWQSQNLVIGGDDEVGYDPILLEASAMRDLGVVDEEWIFLGLDNGRPVFTADITNPIDELPLGQFHDLNKIGAMLGQSAGSLLAYARAMIQWSNGQRFCGACGGSTQPVHGGHVRRCGNQHCRTEHFPRTDPAIIVLVEDGDRCLLGRKEIWPAGVYSTLAGFVEPGESLSEAVIREVHEESGIEVDSVRYQSSQPWPFPASLMIGFYAIRVGGDLRIDGRELADARWFHRDELIARKEIGLRLPGRVSVSRRLIQGWLDDPK